MITLPIIITLVVILWNYITYRKCRKVKAKFNLFEACVYEKWKTTRYFINTSYICLLITAIGLLIIYYCP